MRTLIATLVLSLATCAVSLAAFGAEKGNVIPRKDLPASITAQSAKKAPKFPGIPACAKGRILTDWGTVMDLDDSLTPDKVREHKCSESKAIYACAAFGKMSVRCE